jgi:hypothetical protein
LAERQDGAGEKKERGDSKGETETETERESCSIAQAGLELEILLPQPLECWNYRHVIHASHS